MDNEQLIEGLIQWSKAVGNWRFIGTLKQYVKLVEREDFKEVLERRENESCE